MSVQEIGEDQPCSIGHDKDVSRLLKRVESCLCFKNKMDVRSFSVVYIGLIVFQLSQCSPVWSMVPRRESSKNNVSKTSQAAQPVVVRGGSDGSLLPRGLMKNDPNADEETEMKECIFSSYLIFFLVSFLAAGVLQLIVSKVSVYTIPVSITWFLFGMALTAIVYVPFNNLQGCRVADVHAKKEYFLFLGVWYVSKMSADTIYLVLLPILLYDASLHIKWHHFKRFACSGITLAVFGVAYQVAVIGFLFCISFSDDPVPYQTSPPNTTLTKTVCSNAYLITSAMVSTDPVAVLSVLQSLNAPVKLSTMFEGESLINDGTSVLLFQFFKLLTLGHVVTWYQILTRLFSLLFLAPVLGYLAGVLVYHSIKYFRRYPDTQAIIMVATGYLVYLCGEKYIFTSGPVAIVCYGLYYTSYGHTALGRQGHYQHLYSVHVLAQLANTSIFVIAGSITMRMLWETMLNEMAIPWTLVMHIFIFYIYLVLGRATMIIFFLPLLKRVGYGIDYKEVLLLVWGGLRGAIVLAMGIIIEQDRRIPSVIRYRSTLYIAGTTLVLLVINGVSFELLFMYLNPYPPKPFRRIYLERVMKRIDKLYFKESAILADYWLFQGTEILPLAHRAVPELGGIKMNEHGQIRVKCPNIFNSWFNLLEEMEGTTQNINYPSRIQTSKHSLEEPLTLLPSPPSISSCLKKQGTCALQNQKGVPSAGQPIYQGTRWSCLRGDLPEQTHHYTKDPESQNLPSFFRKLYKRDAPKHRLYSSLKDQHSHETQIFKRFYGLGDSAKFNTHDYIDLLNQNNNVFDERLSDDTQDESVIVSSTPMNSITQHKNPPPYVQHPYPLTRKIPQSPVLTNSKSCLFHPKELERKTTRMLDGLKESTTPDPNTFDTQNTCCSPKPSHSLYKSFPLASAHLTTCPQRTQDPSHGSLVVSGKSQNLGVLSKGKKKDLSPYTSSLSYPKLKKGVHSHVHDPTPGYDSPHPEPTITPIQISHNPQQHSVLYNPVTRVLNNRSVFRSKIAKRLGQKPCSLASSDLDSINSLQFKSYKNNTKDSSSETLHGASFHRSPRTPLNRYSDTPHFPPPTSLSHSIHFNLYRPLMNFHPLKQKVLSAQVARRHRRYFLRPRLRRQRSATRRDWENQKHHIGQMKILRILRKEREGELYLMVFNAIRAMYHRLYEQHLISGATMRSLHATVDTAVDFSIGKLQHGLAHVNQRTSVLKEPEEPLNCYDGSSDVQAFASAFTTMTAFELEWNVLEYRLLKRSCATRLGQWIQKRFKHPKIVSATFCFPRVVCYLQQLCAYVDVHEELLNKGGQSLKALLGPTLLSNYYLQIRRAKGFIVHLQTAWPHGFQFALAVHASNLLIHLKKLLVEEQEQKGLLLEEDSATLREVLEEQTYALDCFRPFNYTALWYLLKNYFTHRH